MKYCVKTGIYLLVNELVNKALFLFLFLFNVVLDYGINKINPSRKFFFTSVSNDDSLDWSYKNRQRVVNKVCKEVEDGDIILMHDIFQSSEEAALEIIDRLQAEGWQFVTVEEVMID